MLFYFFPLYCFIFIVTTVDGRNWRTNSGSVAKWDWCQTLGLVEISRGSLSNTCASFILFAGQSNSGCFILKIYCIFLAKNCLYALQHRNAGEWWDNVKFQHLLRISFGAVLSLVGTRKLVLCFRFPLLILYLISVILVRVANNRVAGYCVKATVTQTLL